MRVWVKVVCLTAALAIVSGAEAAPKKRKSKEGGDPKSGGKPATPEALPVEARVKLPGPTDQLVVGKGGELLFAHVKKTHELVVINLKEQKLVTTIPVPSDDVTLAASADKLYIGQRELAKIQRWNIDKWALEQTVPAPEHGVREIAAPAAAKTPLLIVGDKRVWTMDPATLAVKKLTGTHWGEDGGPGGPEHVYASFDGSTAAVYGGGWAGIDLLTFHNGEKIDIESGGYAHGGVTTTGNGQFVIAAEAVLHADLKEKMADVEGTVIPADNAAFSAAVKKEGASAALTVFANTNPKMQAKLEGLNELAAASKIPMWQRAHVVPQFNTVATLSEAGDEVLFRKLDVTEELTTEGKDYLFVSSSPPTAIQRGWQYRYDLKVVSKRGEVTAEMQTGPLGMRITPEGRVIWQVPPDFPHPMATVVIALKDAGGQTAFQNFTVRLGKYEKKTKPTPIPDVKRPPVPIPSTPQPVW